MRLNKKPLPRFIGIYTIKFYYFWLFSVITYAIHPNPHLLLNLLDHLYFHTTYMFLCLRVTDALVQLYECNHIM